MKLFKTVNNEIIRECCYYFEFPLPSELLDNIGGLISKAILCYVLVYGIILASRHNMHANVSKLVKFFNSYYVIFFLLPLMLANKDYHTCMRT